MKFGLRVRLKRWNDRGEFELERAKSKKNIAENSVTLGYETHNSSVAFPYMLATQNWAHSLMQESFQEIYPPSFLPENSPLE